MARNGIILPKSWLMILIALVMGITLQVGCGDDPDPCDPDCPPTNCGETDEECQ